MYLWTDMNKVKKDLWNKLHQVKNAAKNAVTNLAQVMVNQVKRLNQKLRLSPQSEEEAPVMLSQVQSVSEND